MKQKEPGGRLFVRFHRLPQIAMSTCYIMILLARPAAVTTGDTIWPRFFSTIVAVGR